MNLISLFLVVAVLGMSLYTTDALNKAKEDIRAIKIRTGKLIHLLDAVLVASGGKAAELAAAARSRVEPAYDGPADGPGPTDEPGPTNGPGPTDGPDAISDNVVTSLLSRIMKS